jgi:transcriptional regulator with AAA-type ATPase domain
MVMRPPARATRDDDELDEAGQSPRAAPGALVRIGHLGRLDRDEAELRPLDPDWVQIELGRGEAHGEEATAGGVRLDVADEWMSAPHAVIERGRGAPPVYTLVDRGSKNGTFVLSRAQTGRRVPERITGHRLLPGDLFVTGRTAWRFWGRPLLEPEELVRLSRSPLGPTRSVAPAFLDCARVLERVAPSTLTVLVSGPSGAGKEVAALELHARSGRRGRLIAVNCAALPEGMIEGQLFGHRRGAFTGAVESSPGLVASADGGTLFLDEIGDMPLAAQAKLLRVLEQREVVPLGEVTARKVDVRVVAATHVDLVARVAEGRFRADLLARLAQVGVQLPSLDERLEDLGTLVPHVCEQAGVRLALDAARALFAYHWPFNFRELRSALLAAALLAGDDRVVRAAHLAPAVRGDEMGPVEPAPPTPSRPSRPSAARPSQAELEALLRRHGGNLTAAAREVGKGKMQLYRWLEHYGLDPDRFR